MNPDEAHNLMMAAIDGELDDARWAELEVYLDARAEVRAEFEQMRALAARAEHLRFHAPPPEIWDTYVATLRPKLERQAGFGLLFAGAAGLALAFAVVFVRTPMLSPGLKLLLGAVLAGLSVLFLSVWREKRHVNRHERYGRVRR